MTEEEFWNQLWEESPRVQKMKMQVREQVWLESIQEAEQKLAKWREKRARRQRQMQSIMEKERVDIEAKALRRALVSIVHVRFPDLDEFAQQHVKLFDKPDALNLLIQQMATAPNANIARWLLDFNTKAPG